MKSLIRSVINWLVIVKKIELLLSFQKLLTLLSLLHKLKGAKSTSLSFIPCIKENWFQVNSNTQIENLS
jgi:hypothetical protein